MDKIKYKLEFSKKKQLIYISHLDFLRLISRLFRKARIPIKYSEGFNPHPKFSFPYALPLFIEVNHEYFSCELNKEINEKEFLERINKVSPNGLIFLNCQRIYNKIIPSNRHEYDLYLSHDGVFIWKDLFENNKNNKMLSKVLEYKINNDNIHIVTKALFNPFRLISDMDNKEILKDSIQRVVKKA